MIMQQGAGMEAALQAARKAGQKGEVPVGASILDRHGRLVSVAGNAMRRRCDPLAHAEVIAIRRACKELGQYRLTGCQIFVTLEPCPMCATAISLARLARLYYGAADEKTGAVEGNLRFFELPQCHHRPEIIGGVNETEAGDLLRSFFAELRKSDHGRTDAIR